MSTRVSSTFSHVSSVATGSIKRPMIPKPPDVTHRGPYAWQVFKHIIWPPASFVFCHQCAEGAAEEEEAYKPAAYVNVMSEYRCEECQHIFAVCEKKNEKFEANERHVTCGQLEYRVSFVWLAIAITIYMLLTLGQNVGAIMMGLRMPPFPEFLLWFPQVLGTIVTMIATIVTGEGFKASWQEHIQFMWLGLWSSLNGILAQFAIPFVAPELTTLLSQIAIPVIWISSWIFFRWSLTPFRLIMFTFIMLGLLTGVVPSIFLGSGGGGAVETSPFWAIVTVFGILPIAFLFTFQERLFKEHGTGIWITLNYLNIYTTIAYVLSIPILMLPGIGDSYTWDEVPSELVWMNQWQALQCFFGYGQAAGLHLVPPSESSIPCQDGATTWVLIFTVGYFGQFIVGAVLLQVRDSNLLANLTALGTPLQAVVFWVPFIVGADAQEPVSWVAVSVVTICIADLLYERYSDPASLPKDAFGRFMESGHAGHCLAQSVIPDSCRQASKSSSVGRDKPNAWECDDSEQEEGLEKNEIVLSGGKDTTYGSIQRENK